MTDLDLELKWGCQVLPRLSMGHRGSHFVLYGGFCLAYSLC